MSPKWFLYLRRFNQHLTCLVHHTMLTTCTAPFIVMYVITIHILMESTNYEARFVMFSTISLFLWFRFSNHTVIWNL
jgi:hypothetical protein